MALIWHTKLTCEAITVPGNVVRRGLVFASRDPASSPSEDDDVQPVLSPHRDEVMSVYPGPSRGRALFFCEITLTDEAIKIKYFRSDSYCVPRGRSQSPPRGPATDQCLPDLQHLFSPPLLHSLPYFAFQFLSATNLRSKLWFTRVNISLIKTIKNIWLCVCLILQIKRMSSEKFIFSLY